MNTNIKVKPFGRQEELVTQELKNEVLIYDLRIHKAISLNETSALIWQECDGTKDVAQITETVSRKFKMPVTEDLVWLALKELNKENLIENSSELNPRLSGMSRRDLIRKVGLGTMIALPLISSLIAPTAAHAQSSGLGAACTQTCTGGAAADTCPTGANLCCNTVNCVPTPGGGPGDVTCTGTCIDAGVAGDCGFTC